VSLPVGVLLALLLVKTDLPARKLAALLLGVLLFVPLYLQCAAWQAGFGLQGCYTLAYHGVPLLAGWRGAVWVHAMAAVPWAALLIGLGVRFVAPELEEQALLDGTPAQVFCRLTLRRAAAAVMVAAIWISVTVAGEMTVTDLFGIRTYAEEVYTQLSLGGWTAGRPLRLWSGAALIGLLTMAAGFACVKLAPTSSPTTVRPAWKLPLGRLRGPALLVVLACLVLIVAVPISNLAYKAGLTVTQTEAGRVRCWSLAKGLSVVWSSPGAHYREFGWSLTIGVCAASAAVALAILFGWLARRGGTRSVPAIVLAAACLAVPGPLLGLGLIWLLNWQDVEPLAYLYDYTIVAPWLAQTVRAFPLAILIVWHALASVPDETLESAAVEGAGWLRRFVFIGLPGRATAVAAAWLVGLVVALGELAATVLVVPPGMPTLSVRIFGLLHYGVDDRVAGICLAIVAIVSLLTISTYLLAAAFGRHVRPKQAGLPLRSGRSPVR
jgi:iron(III) transport system permease protein